MFYSRYCNVYLQNCGEITITPVQPTPPPEPQSEKAEEVVQLVITNYS